LRSGRGWTRSPSRVGPRCPVRNVAVRYFGGSVGESNPSGRRINNLSDQHLFVNAVGPVVVSAHVLPTLENILGPILARNSSCLAAHSPVFVEVLVQPAELTN
jgi:hypothetical protein